jgi:putative cell wall-binding protein
VALLRLHRPVDAPPVQLAAGPDWLRSAPGMPATLVGWGSTDRDGRRYPTRLHEAATEVRADRSCMEALGRFDLALQTCTAAPRAATCVGDSGGPVVVPVGRSWMQIGVISAGPDRCGSAPDLHSDVSAFAPWLAEVTGQDATAGSRVRIGAGNVYADAVAITRSAFEAGQEVVHVATGEQFPDGLAGGALAAESGPLLLVPSDELPDVVHAELQRLAPDRIVIFGGEAAVSAEVAHALQTVAPTGRLAGDNRYETAAAVSGSWAGPVHTVFVATGEAYPDALAAVPLTLGSGPLLLTRQHALPPVTAERIQSLQPSEIVVLGGEAAISAGVASQLAEHAPVRRVGGENRFDTAALLATDPLAPAEPPFVYASTGDGFGHALAGGVVAAIHGSPLVLSRPNWVEQPVADALTALAPSRVVVLGGHEQVSEDVAAALESLSTR